MPKIPRRQPQQQQKQTVYAFIDSQNLNIGISSEGWKLDFRKFRQYLRDRHNVSQAYLFIGNVAGNEQLYANLEDWGYTVIFKPTQELPDESVKGNVDAELVLHAMIEYPNYDQAVIVSGDGDFRCLVEYLEGQDKLARLLVPNRQFSGLLRDYIPYIVRIDKLRARLEHRSQRSRKKS